jgi:hypothetical protein
MDTQTFPALAKLLENFRSGLRQFGYSEIQGLFRGRRDRDFKKKPANRLKLLQDAIREIQKKDVKHSGSDPGQIRFLLWERISSVLRAASKSDWDAEKIGRYVVSHLQARGDERLVCFPLFESVAPWRKQPQLYTLAHDVWLIEPSRSADRLLRQLEELLGSVTHEIKAEIRKIDDPSESELGALLSEPLLACRTRGFFSQRDYALWRYSMPLIALDNIKAVNKLDTSDDLALWYYMMKLGPPAWSKELQREWKSAHDDPIAIENGLTEPHHIVSIADGSRKVWSYDFNLKIKTISAVHWSSKVPEKTPPLLILPSLMNESITAKFINHGLHYVRDQRRTWTKDLLMPLPCGVMRHLIWKYGTGREASNKTIGHRF